MKRKLLYIVVLFTLMSACQKVNVQNPVPELPVYMRVNLMNEGLNLDIVGGFYEIYPMPDNRIHVNRSGNEEVLYNDRYDERYGYAGVVIYHTFDDRFVAYDLCCPNETRQDVRVSCSMDGTARCDSCGTVYNIGFQNGWPASGSSHFPLREYNVMQYVNEITVRN